MKVRLKILIYLSLMGISLKATLLPLGIVVLHKVRKPVPGEWTIKVTGLHVLREGEYYLLNVSGDSPVVTNVLETRQFYPPGEFVKIRVKVSRKRQASGGWVITGGIPAKVSAQITAPDGQTDALALYDDGKHADGKAGDGVFGGVYTKTSKEGTTRQKLISQGHSHGRSCGASLWTNEQGTRVI